MCATECVNNAANALTFVIARRYLGVVLNRNRLDFSALIKLTLTPNT